MKSAPFEDRPFFSWSPVLPCPYLNGRHERRIIAELGHINPVTLHDELSEVGFRRSHNLVYRPACPNCSECIPVRVILSGFQPTRSQKRVSNQNSDLQIKVLPPSVTKEQFDLFSKYQFARHEYGEMSKMSFTDYRAMVEDTPINTSFIEYRLLDGTLVAGLLMDQTENGVSAVYSFFDPDYEARSLGKFMILWLINYAQNLKKSYVYLGFWVKGSKKMDYKTNFKPLEHFTEKGWVKM